MMEGLDSFSWLWQNPEYSDASLKLVALAEDETVVDTCTFPIHGQLLASLSPGYFRPRLTAWRHQTQEGNPGQPHTTAEAVKAGDTEGQTRDQDAESKPVYSFGYGKVCLEEHCLEDQLSAALAVLEFGYKGKLPDTKNVQLLAQMCWHADYWDMKRCLDAALTALSDLADDKGEDGWQDIAPAILIMPSHVLDLPAGKRLVSALKPALLENFGDAVEVLTDEAQLQQFCTLPFAIILEWAKTAKVVSDSENTVVLLLSCWVAHQYPSHASVSLPENHMLALSQCLRLYHLTVSFHVQVLPNLSWVVPAKQTCEHHAAIHVLREMMGSSVKCSHDVALVPAQCEPRVQRYEQVLLYTRLTRQQLSSMWESCESVSLGPPQYLAGFSWEVNLGFTDQEGQRCLGLYVTAQPCEQLKKVLPASVADGIVTGAKVSAQVGRAPEMSADFILGSSAVGWSDVLCGGRVSDLDYMLWKHAEQGTVKIMVRVPIIK